MLVKGYFEIKLSVNTFLTYRESKTRENGLEEVYYN